MEFFLMIFLICLFFTGCGARTHILTEVNGKAHFVDFSSSVSGFSTTPRTGQELLDYAIDEGFCIHTFVKRKDALEFMLEGL